MIHSRALVRTLGKLTISFLFACLTASALTDQSGEQHEASETPLLLGIIVDTHAHQHRVIEFERTALSSLLETFPNIRLFVLSYAERPAIAQDWTTTALPSDLAEHIVIDPQSDIEHGASLWDAMGIGLSKLNSENGQAKSLIVIGEGNDGASVIRYRDVKELARKAHVQCFALLVADHNLIGGRVRHYGFYLNELASATHGASFDIESNKKKLRKALSKISKRIDGQRGTH